MDKNELNNERNYYVVKNNELIQNSRFSLTLQQQKIVLYLISKIQPDDTEFMLYEFKINDFCEVCGIDKNNGKNFNDLKTAIKDLADKSMWVHIDAKGTETLLRWIEKPYFNANSGTIEVRLDKDMKPYLLQLKKKYTQFSLKHTLLMKSRYSVRLFELLRSYVNLNKWTVSVDELRTTLDAEHYFNFFDFNRKVLQIAVREINDYGDIDVAVKFIKDGRKVVKIQFDMKIKKDMPTAWISLLGDEIIEK